MFSGWTNECSRQEARSTSAIDASRPHVARSRHRDDRGAFPSGAGALGAYIRNAWNRLSQEFRQSGISTMQAANRFLRESYLPKRNVRFLRPAEGVGTAFVHFRKDLSEHPCVQFDRMVGNGNAARYNGRTLQISEKRHRTATRVSSRGFGSNPTTIWRYSTVLAASDATRRAAWLLLPRRKTRSGRVPWPFGRSAGHPLAVCSGVPSLRGVAEFFFSTGAARRSRMRARISGRGAANHATCATRQADEPRRTRLPKLHLSLGPVGPSKPNDLRVPEQ